jgi:beta-lactamase regulating signal transducer with metallopeptidase domain
MVRQSKANPLSASNNEDKIETPSSPKVADPSQQKDENTVSLSDSFSEIENTNEPESSYQSSSLPSKPSETIDQHHHQFISTQTLSLWICIFVFVIAVFAVSSYFCSSQNESSQRKKHRRRKKRKHQKNDTSEDIKLISEDTSEKDEE